MRTYSTPQSALNGEITKLAIIECVVSAALYVGLGVYLGTFKHLAMAVAIAPLMLFRTELSADWGLILYFRTMANLIEWFNRKGEMKDYAVILIYIAMVVVGTTIRFIATFYWAFRRPLHTLRETPSSWMRQALCTDLAHPPEMVPKEALVEDIKAFTFTPLYKNVREADFTGKIVCILVYSPLLLFGWLPSMIYRVSFKATAIAYVPLVWVAHSTLRNPLPLKVRLERFTKGELEKFRRVVSYFVLITLVAKGALVFNWIDRDKVEAMFPSQKIMTDFVVLNAWPWWQITFGADALLTFALLYFADAALSRIEAQKLWREESVMTTVVTFSFLRALFAIVTIAHFFYIALVAAVPEWARYLPTL